MLNEMRKEGLFKNKKINLKEFKQIIEFIKDKLDAQLDYREKMENIIKFELNEDNEMDFKYLCQDFYLSFQEFLYGKNNFSET